jgi:hypothetical protein
MCLRTTYTVLCCAAASLAGTGCSPSVDTETVAHEPQFVEVQLQYGFQDEVDTFRGHLTKDLVMDGSITVPFWMSKENQESILLKAEELSFFQLLDRIPAREGVAVCPDPSPDLLRIRSGHQDKTVVWSYPLDPENTQASAVKELSGFIMEIVRQTDAYRRLPDARGGRL